MCPQREGSCNIDQCPLHGLFSPNSLECKQCTPSSGSLGNMAAAWTCEERTVMAICFDSAMVAHTSENTTVNCVITKKKEGLWGKKNGCFYPVLICALLQHWHILIARRISWNIFCLSAVFFVCSANQSKTSSDGKDLRRHRSDTSFLLWVFFSLHSIFFGSASSL